MNLPTSNPANIDVLPSGSMLSGYQITGLIGQGGFGVVYVGRDTQSGRTVAIKEFLPTAIAGRASDGRIAPRSADFVNAFAAGLKGFLREANLLAEFAHPALVAVHRAWEENGTAYMAMQYYPGKTLRDVRVKATTSPTEGQIQRWLAPVFEAVAELHAHRVIHRDISPDNILVMPDGATVLLDLGAARQVLGGMTQALTTILKPGFAPIEQYVEDGSMEQGRWTDVYGLGAVIYFLGTGRPPTPATSRIIRDSMLPLHEAAPAAGYSPALLTSVGRALSIRAIDRFKNMAEFRAALGWIKQPRAALPAAEVTTTSAPLETSQREILTAPVVSAPVAPPPLSRPSSAPAAAAKVDKPALAELRSKGAGYDASSPAGAKWGALVAIALVAAAGAWFLLR